MVGILKHNLTVEEVMSKWEENPILELKVFAEDILEVSFDQLQYFLKQNNLKLYRKCLICSSEIDVATRKKTCSNKCKKEYGYKYPKREEAIKKGYRSGFEQTICESLNKDLKFEYEALKLPWYDHKEHTYTPDLIFEKKNGELLILEIKGYLDASTKSKMINVKKTHPELDIRFVFQNPNTKLSKKSKSTYADWADKNGFPWCGPKVNKDWLKNVKKINDKN